MNIQSISFKRYEGSDWERGLIIRGEKESVVLDMEAKIINGTVWDMRDQFELIVNFE